MEKTDSGVSRRSGGGRSDWRYILVVALTGFAKPLEVKEDSGFWPEWLRMEFPFIEMGETCTRSLVLDMLNFRYLLDIQVRCR